MTKYRFAIAALAGLALLLGSVSAAEPIASGPQVGQKVPGPFYPLNINGPTAGEKACLFCRNGTNPVAMIFARETNPEVAKLIKKIDAATVAHQDAKMGSFVVFLGDSDELSKQLKGMVAKEGIKSCVLSVDNPAGPEAYKVAKDAAVTVVLYTQHTVKANYAFKNGELKDKDIDQIVGDLSKILPKK